MYAKVFQKAGFKLESGAPGAGQAPGWGDVNAVSVIGANDAIPYTSLGKTKTINSVADNSIVGEGFSDVPRKVSSYVEQSIKFINKFDGLNPLLYWGYGLEDLVLSTVCYVCNVPASEPTPADTYTDASSNAMTFLRKEVNKDITYYIFKQTATVAGQTGTLTKATGLGSNLVFTAKSPILYEHLFFLDPHERHYMPIRTEEQYTGYMAGAKKCRMATIGVNTDADTDFRNTNAMCKKIGITSQAGALSEVSIDFLARAQDIADHSSDTWTYPSTLGDSDSNIVHHQWMLELAPVGDALSAGSRLAVTSFNVDIDVPLQVIQDTVSGLYIAEPVMEGKYGMGVDIVLSRYSSTAFQDYRDAWTNVKCRISALSGYLLQEILVNNAVITAAGPDEDNVSKEPLKLDPGYDETNNFASYMSGSSLTCSPIMLRVRNTTSGNQMLM